MFVIAEVARVVRSVLGYGFRGRRVGVLALVVLGVIALAVSSAATVTIPLVIYPFL